MSLRLAFLLPPLLAAAGLKAWLAAAGLVPFNADEAVVALMARHILLGERPVFFYGQAYMGSLDAWLVAGGFALFGEQVWVIRLVQGCLYLLTLATTAWLGITIFHSWRVGAAAAWLLALPAVNLTLYTTASLGGYGEALLIGNLILLASLRIGKLLDGTGRAPAWLWLCWGSLVGLGLWAFGLTLVYSLPSGIYLSWKLFRRTVSILEQRSSAAQDVRKRWFTPLSDLALPLFWIACGALLGSAPWWGYALQHGFRQLIVELSGGNIAGVEGLSGLELVAQHLASLILLGGTAVFGLRPPWEVRWLVLPLLPFVLLFWLGVLAHAGRLLYRLRSARPAESIDEPVVSLGHLSMQTGGSKQTGGSNSPTGPHVRPADRSARPGALSHQGRQPAQPDGLLLLAGVAFTLAAGFLFTPFGADPSGRYFLPLSIPLALFAADLVARLREKYGTKAWVLLVLVLVYNLLGTLQCAQRTPPGLTTQFNAITQIDTRYNDELIAFLRRNGVSRGYTNYWVAYPLAFLSGEELIFAPRLPYHPDFRYTGRDDRYAPYGVLAGQAERPAYITTRHPALNAHLRRCLQESGLTWQEVQIGDYYIFYDLSQKFSADRLSSEYSRP